MALAHRAKMKDPAKAFISTWRTSITYSGSTANNQIKLPLEIGGTYKFTVDWGDTTSSVITTWNQAETTHTYPAPGDYIVTITGFIKGWDFGQGGTVAPTTGDMRKLLTITQWGCLRLVTHLDPVPLRIWGTFYGCTNLNLTTVTDMPNFKGTISIHGFFRGCNAVTTINNINKWDVSKIEIFRSALREMPLFDGNVGNWNTASATNFLALFSGPGNGIATGIFNNGGSDSIRNWNTSNVTGINQCFAFQAYFNQPVGDWDISNATDLTFMFRGVASAPYGTFNNGGSDSIKNWDTSKVTSLWQTFVYQRNFNQPIGSWDTSKVTNMQFMFQEALAFNQPLGNWDVSLVINFGNFMFGKTFSDYSAANYDTLLIGWASRPVKPNLSINFGIIKYTAAATAAKAILTSAPNNWTIVDGGLV